MIANLLLALLIATPVNVDAQLKAAKGGDEVRFVGALGSVAIKNRVFSPPLTLTAAAGTTLAGLYLDGVQGVNVPGPMHIIAKPGDWKGAFYAVNFAHVRVNGADIEAANGPGVTFRQGFDASLGTSRVRGAHNAVLLLGVMGAAVSDNALTGMSGDGVDVYSSSHVVVARNVCAEPRHIDASHQDCVQLADTIAGAAPMSDVDVGFNVARGAMQGFTSFRPNPGHVRISIHDNTVVSNFPQGVALYDGDAGSSVRNNHVYTMPGAANQTKVNVIGGATSHCGNTTGAGGGKPATAQPRCAATPGGAKP